MGFDFMKNDGGGPGMDPNDIFSHFFGRGDPFGNGSPFDNVALYVRVSLSGSVKTESGIVKSNNESAMDAEFP